MPGSALIVYAHELDTSFNHALLETARGALAAAGHAVTVSDLYKMGWNPVLSVKDITDLDAAAGHVHWPTEAGRAYSRGSLAPDIRAEQAKVAAADLIVFQFPLQWLSAPAILKGWMERVLTEGFSFVPAEGKMFDNGPLKGKRAVLSLTTGSGGGAYTPYGVCGDISAVLWPIHCSLRLTGLTVLPPQLSWAPGSASPADRTAMLKAWESRLGGILQEPGLYFAPLASLRPAPAGGYELPHDFTRDDDKAGEFAITVAQHFYRPVRKPESGEE